jgi:hypothetical protein
MDLFVIACGLFSKRIAILMLCWLLFSSIVIGIDLPDWKVGLISSRQTTISFRTVSIMQSRITESFRHTQLESLERLVKGKRKVRCVDLRRNLGFETLELRALLASVEWDTAGDLIYAPTAVGDRVPDFSNVGYRGGVVGIPNVPVVLTVQPVAGDDMATIQAAIDQVEAMPLNPDGFRGAVLLQAGEYQISDRLNINASGIVLRGEGDGPTGTVLRATGTTQRTLIRFAGSGSRSTVAGTTRQIVDKVVPVGARSFQVDSTAGLAVGETVIVNRPTTTEWVAAIGMNLLDIPWVAGNHEPNWDRVITRIEGNSITVDAPLTNSLDLNYGGGNIRQYTWANRISNVGVENLRGISDFASATDENHATWLVEMTAMENGWIRNLQAYNFRQGIVTLKSTSKWVTVDDCESYDPKSPIVGGERYTYDVYGQLNLVQNSHASQGRHDYVIGSAVPGPNVFVNNTAVNAYSDTGPHHRWSTGGLFDNLDIDGNNINVQNRGNSGTGHGFAGANMVIWNSTADGFIVHNPPTAQNWLVGSTGPISGGTFFVGPHDPGTVESHGVAVQPRSLYHAQLQERLAYPNLAYREYWKGDIDGFNSTNGTGDNVAVDPAWQAQFDAATTVPLSNFDNLTNPQAIPFTFDFPLDPGDQIVGATLSFGLRATAADLSSNRLFIDSLTDNPTFASLGWIDIATTGTTTKVLNLASRLSTLQDGRLNLGILQNTAIDWVVLNLQVAPTNTVSVVNLSPEADAYVKSGVSADQNFGTTTTLQTKEDSNVDLDRRSFLRFDLSNINGIVERATLRLIPTSVGTTIENRVSYVANDAWGETTINWNNQPDALPFGGDVVMAGSSYEVVVTPLAQEAIVGDRELTLRIDSPINLGGSGIVTYGSKENANASVRPVLILELTPASIANRRVFYNRSTSTIFGNGTGNPINAIDPTKSALLPGETASTIANYTNYSRGLNGIVVDIANPINLNGISAASFQFATWSNFTDSTPNFVTINPTADVSTFASGGLNGSDRVKLEFSNNAIQNAWLRVTMLANPNTGLATNDVFYFGNARFDVTPTSPFPSQQVTINIFDVNTIRSKIGQNLGGISNVFDVDRNGVINVFDTNAVRSGQGVSSLRSFVAPSMMQMGLAFTGSSTTEMRVDTLFADTSWLDAFQVGNNKNRQLKRG